MIICTKNKEWLTTLFGNYTLNHRCNLPAKHKGRCICKCGYSLTNEGEQKRYFIMGGVAVRDIEANRRVSEGKTLSKTDVDYYTQDTHMRGGRI